MKKIVLTVLCSILLLSVWAQNKPTTTGIVDQNAQNILKKVSDKVKGFSSLDIDFTMTIEDKANNKSDEYKGSILLQGAKYKLEMKDQKVYCNAKTIWTYLPDVQEVQIYNYDSTATDNLNLNTLLNTYNRDFRPKLIKEETRGKVVVQIIDLVPIKSKDYFKVRLSVNKNTLQIEQIESYFKSGVVNTLKINKYTPNPRTVTNTDFTFVTPANVEEIDMR